MPNIFLQNNENYIINKSKSAKEIFNEKLDFYKKNQQKIITNEINTPRKDYLTSKNKIQRNIQTANLENILKPTYINLNINQLCCDNKN